MLDYLARYTHRVAISNERILGIDGNEVLLRVRADGKSGRKRTLRLAGTEFIERFLQHVLPCGFKRIRHYGLLAPAHKRKHLAAARAALGAPSPQPALIESVAAFLRRVAHIETARCPHCGSGQLRLVAVIRPQSSPARSAGATVTIDVSHCVAQQPNGETVRALARPRRTCECGTRRPSEVPMVLRHHWRASQSVAASARAMPFD